MNIMHILLIMLVSLFLLFLLYQFRELNQKKRALFNLIIQFRNHFEFNEELEEILNDKDYLIDELNDVIECYENKELEDTEEIINQNIFLVEQNHSLREENEKLKSYNKELKEDYEVLENDYEELQKEIDENEGANAK